MKTSTTIDSLDVTAYRQADARLRRDGQDEGDGRDKREVSLVYAVYLVGSVRGVPERDKRSRLERLFSRTLRADVTSSRRTVSNNAG